MAARLWTALLMLAAVFAMHGVQCTAAADTAGTAGTTAHVGSVAMTALSPGHAHAAAAAASPDDPMLSQSAATGTEGTAGALAEAGHGSAPHDAAAHLWAVCLAVLAAALAGVLTALVPRSVRLTAPALGYVRARLRSPALPRPPDLSALCLLRI
jgi:hypothetical protein